MNVKWILQIFVCFFYFFSIGSFASLCFFVNTCKSFFNLCLIFISYWDIVDLQCCVSSRHFVLNREHCVSDYQFFLA